MHAWRKRVALPRFGVHGAKTCELRISALGSRRRRLVAAAIIDIRGIMSRCLAVHGLWGTEGLRLVFWRLLEVCTCCEPDCVSPESGGGRQGSSLGRADLAAHDSGGRANGVVVMTY